MSEPRSVTINVETLMAKGKKFISIDSLLLSLYQARETGNIIAISDLINTLKKLKEKDQ